MLSGSSPFETTLEGFERAFQVRHIATYDVVMCAALEQVHSVFARYPDFDQIPVAVDGRIVGVLEARNVERSGSVEQHMRRLDDSILIAADAPLNHFLPLLREAPYYRLVLDGARIRGVVTRSDILKLPVRLFAFGLVTHLEMVMADIIQSLCPHDWMQHLDAERQAQVTKKEQELQAQRANPDRLELTDFCDKRDIVRQICKLSNRFKDDLVSIERMRNSIAHAGNYAANDQELIAFLKRLDRAQYWIRELYQRNSPVAIRDSAETAA